MNRLEKEANKILGRGWGMDRGKINGYYISPEFLNWIEERQQGYLIYGGTPKSWKTNVRRVWESEGSL